VRAGVCGCYGGGGVNDPNIVCIMNKKKKALEEVSLWKDSE
jgi:hypothetical protein